MRVSIVQHDIVWGQPAENVRRLTQMLDQQSGADLYVLSETFATGFMADEAIPQEPNLLAWLQAQAREKDAAFAASMAVRDDEGKMRNRLFFVRPDGSYDYYDKRHLFSYAGETDAYEAGERRVVTEWRGVRFLLQVCYDLRFPVFSRNSGDYDAIIYVANWPTQRMDVWQTLLKARALENQCVVVGVNRVGQDPACSYCGGSVIIDAYGRTLAACEDTKEGVATASLDMEKQNRFRSKFPVLGDADPFSMRL